MININGNELATPIKMNDIYSNLVPNYANVRNVDLEEFDFNNFTVNATFKDDGKYYISQNINNISEREAIMDLVKNEKYFGEKEKQARNKIIEKIAVKHQNNFFDYYA